MNRSLTTDGLESLLLGEQSLSLAYSPSLAGLEDGACSKAAAVDYDFKPGGDSIPMVESLYGMKPDALPCSRSDSDRSSYGMLDSELLCPPTKKKRPSSPPTLRTQPNLHPDATVGQPLGDERMHGSVFVQMVYRARQGSYSSPIFFVQDTGSSYRAPPDMLLEAPRDQLPYSQCHVGDYSHQPMTLERILSTPGTQYAVQDPQNPDWMTQTPQMHHFLQDPGRSVLIQSARHGAGIWSVQRSTSDPTHLQLSPEITRAKTELSRQLYVYPGRPVESLEKEYDRPVPSGKRRVNRKRENLPKESTAVLKQWLLSHLLMPYPGNEEKAALCCSTGLEISQINNWFINARVRIWKPLVTRVYQKYQPQLKALADESGDDTLAKRVDEADKSTTMGMITLLSSLPEARKALNEAAEASVAALIPR